MLAVSETAFQEYLLGLNGGSYNHHKQRSLIVPLIVQSTNLASDVGHGKPISCNLGALFFMVH